jgi:hypothetical protein
VTPQSDDGCVVMKGKISGRRARRHCGNHGGYSGPTALRSGHQCCRRHSRMLWGNVARRRALELHRHDAGGASGPERS